MSLTPEQRIKAYVEYAPKLILRQSKLDFIDWLEREQPDIAQSVMAQLLRLKNEKQRAGFR